METLAAHPIPQKWNVAEVLDHLRLSYTGTIKGFTRLLDGGVPLASPLPLRKRAMQMYVFGFRRLPEGRRAPKGVIPGRPDVGTIVRDTLAAIEQMDALIELAARRFGTDQRVLDHPILGALTVNGWRKFHLIHGMHHVKQIRERIALAHNSRSASAL